MGSWAHAKLNCGQEGSWDQSPEQNRTGAELYGGVWTWPLVGEQKSPQL